MPSIRLQVYETPNLRVTWDPDVCRNSEACVRALPAVFGEREGRWIHPENAAADAVLAAVARCPSGALKAQYVTSVVPRARRDGA